MLIENIGDLRVLVQTARTGSLTGAARALGITPAAASATLKRLESQLGVRLFERSTRAMRLTPQGQILLDYASRAFDLVAEGEAQATLDRAGLVGLIRLAAPSDLARSTLLPWLDEFMEAHPGVQLALSVGDRPLDVVRDEVDLAIRYGHLVDSRLVARRLIDTAPVVAASPAYLARHPAPRTPMDLLQHNCLAYDRAGRPHRTWRFTRDGQSIEVQVNGDRSVDDASLARQWALAGAGIGYEWHGQALGGRRSRRPGSRHIALREAAFAGYADHMDTAEFRTAVRELADRAATERLAVMCAETLWWRCHRMLIADALAMRGYQEVVTFAFVDPALQSKLFPQTDALPLANPIASDLAVMRVSLWPGLLRAALENQRRQQDRVRLFEHGTRFVTEDGKLREIDSIAGIALGPRLPEQWGAKRESVDFFDVKADVEALAAATGALDSFAWEPATLPCLHPGRSARIVRNGQPVGWIGELHPALARELEFTQPPILFELDYDAALTVQVPSFKTISRFPQVRRDIAVVVDESVSLSALRERVTLTASSLLRDLRVFDVYRGPGVETGRKSVALGLIFQDISRTLTDEDADRVVASIVADLRTSLDARLRE